MSTVVTHREGRVLVARLNRPEVLNAFNPELTDCLARVVEDAGGDPEVSVLTVTGTGRAFSAGYDLSAAPDPEREYGTAALIRRLALFPKPLILAINGVAVGFGATLTSLADVTVVADSARLRCPFVGMGLSPEAGSTYQLPKLMGHQQAAWFLMSGEWLSAQECVEAGLALARVPDAQLLPKARAFADVLAAQPLESLMETKRLLTEPHREQLIASISAENAAVVKLQRAPAYREAVAAFRERREPTVDGGIGRSEPAQRHGNDQRPDLGQGKR